MKKIGSRDEFLKTHLEHLLGEYTVLPKDWGFEPGEHSLGAGYEDNSDWEELMRIIERESESDLPS